MTKKNNCDIKAETKLRNGYPNWWCYTHFASARGEKGAKLDKCSKADKVPVLENERITIDLTQYKGGVGIWGSLKAVYDTKREEPEKGVHVHLRRFSDQEQKEVDATFKEVFIQLPNSSLYESSTILIDEETACAYTASVVFNRAIKVVNCKHCGRPHVDADWFAVHKHKKHFCTFCGRDFIDIEHGISNPVVLVQQIFKEQLAHRKLEKIDRKLSVKQADYPGGIQIWGSNPAIIWTKDKPEEAGIHVHLFVSKDAPPVSDETYGTVEIDGIALDDEMIRYYMVQKSFSFLEKYLTSLDCPYCGQPHFDTGDKAYTPHKIHHCEHCDKLFEDETRYKGVVSNPIIAKLTKLADIYNSTFHGQS